MTTTVEANTILTTTMDHELKREAIANDINGKIITDDLSSVQTMGCVHNNISNFVGFARFVALTGMDKKAGWVVFFFVQLFELVMCILSLLSGNRELLFHYILEFITCIFL